MLQCPAMLQNGAAEATTTTRVATNVRRNIVSLVEEEEVGAAFRDDLKIGVC